MSTWQAALKARPPHEVIVFIVGGSTYEEARAVSEWNAAKGQTMRVLLGSSALLNTDSFLDALGCGGDTDSHAVTVM